MFDANLPIEIPIRSGGDRRAMLRWPTDEELIDRSKKMRYVRRDLGRNQSVFDVPNATEVNANLFALLRQDPDPEAVDDAEASKFVERLLRADVVESHRQGDQFIITLSVVNRLEVTHTLRMPTQRELLDYSRQAMRTIDNRRSHDTRVTIEPSGQLWDKLLVSTEGYKNGNVPIIHKDAALVEVMAQMESEDADPEG
jgi:hypothetical protein